MGDGTRAWRAMAVKPKCKPGPRNFWSPERYRIRAGSSTTRRAVSRTSTPSNLALGDHGGGRFLSAAGEL